MKKRKVKVISVIVLSLLLIISCFTLSNLRKREDANVIEQESEHVHHYVVNTKGTFICDEDKAVFEGTDRPYIAVIGADGLPEQVINLSDLNENETPIGNGSVSLKDHVLSYNGTSEQTVYICSEKDADKKDEIIVNAPNDEVSHYGSATVVEVEKVKTSSFQENSDVDLVTLTQGRLVMEKNAGVKEVFLDINNENHNYETTVIALKDEAELPKLTRDNIELGINETKIIAIVENVSVTNEKIVDTKTNEEKEVKVEKVDSLTYIKITRTGEAEVGASISKNTETIAAEKTEEKKEAINTLEESSNKVSSNKTKEEAIIEVHKKETETLAVNTEEKKETTKKEVEKKEETVIETPVIKEDPKPKLCANNNHTLVYTAITHEGTEHNHKVTCSNPDCELNYIEHCEMDENGICKKCGRKFTAGGYDKNGNFVELAFNEDATLTSGSLEDITTVILPDSVKTIATSAFQSNKTIKTIYIPATVTEFKDYAFKGCTNLEKVVFLKDEEGKTGITDMGKGPFFECSSLKSFTVPENVTILHSATFYKCKSLESVDLANIEYIGKGPAEGSQFSDCTSLTSIKFPKTLKSIVGWHAFLDCYNLTDVDFSECTNLTDIGNQNTFKYCYGLTVVDLSNTKITAMKDYVFDECVNLVEVIFPDTLKSIYTGWAWGCYRLAKVVIPAGVTSIQSGAFGYAHLYDVTDLRSEANKYKYSGGLSYSAPNVETNKTLVDLMGKESTTVYKYPNSSTTRSLQIDGNLFKYAKQVASTDEYSHKFDENSVFSTDSTNYIHNINDFIIYDDGVNTPILIDYIGMERNLVLPEYSKNYKIAENAFELVEKSYHYAWNQIYAGATISENVIVKVESITIPACVILDDFAAFDKLIAVGQNNTDTHGWNYSSKPKASYLSAINIAEDHPTHYSVNGIVYRKADNAIIFIPKNISGDIVIGKDVTSICDQAFNNTDITSVIFEEGSKCQSIGKYAFCNCDSLTSIAIPASVTSIGEGAFQGSGLNQVMFEEESQLESIGQYAFGSCSFNSFTIPESVSEIGSCAFRYCQNLTSIVIPSKVTEINYETFYGCYDLETVTFAENSVCSSIGEEAFCRSSITELVLPEGLTTICSYALSYSEYLEKLVIPSTVSQFDKTSVYGCISLTELTIDPNNSHYSCDGTFVYNWDQTELYFALNDDDQNLVIPASVVKIADGAFKYNENIETVSFAEGSNLASIGEEAFYDCVRLQTINLPDSIEKIGDEAFEDCYSLSFFPVSENANLISIGELAFSDCYALESVTIPASVSSIGDGAFNCCSHIQTLNFMSGSNLTAINDGVFCECEDISAVTIPKNVTSIGEYAFGYCYSLETVLFEEGTQIQLADIASNAFDCCPCEGNVDPANIAQ